MAKFTVTNKTKKQKIKEAIIILLENGHTDWDIIRKTILTDSDLNAYPAEFKRIEKELITENVIDLNS